MRTQRKAIELLKYQNNSGCKFVFVVLNHDNATEESVPTFNSHYKQLWEKAVYRVCVDGGSNLIHRLNQSLAPDKTLVPDLVSGDFDSVDVQVLDEFERLGSEIVPTPDQDHTDFTKCLMILNEKLMNGDIPAGAEIIAAVPECTQRMDHAMANINTLYKARVILTGGNDLSLVSSKTLQRLVPEGESDIRLHGSLSCRPFFLLPIRKQAVVSTVGLENELVENRTEFSCPFSSFKCFPKAASIKISTSASLLLAVNIVS